MKSNGGCVSHERAAEDNPDRYPCLAVDSSGHWFAWGSGCKDDSDFREESLALFRKNVWLDRTDDIGNDAADVEHFAVLAEIPVPDHVVFAQSVKPAQRTLFEEAHEPIP